MQIFSAMSTPNEHSISNCIAFFSRHKSHILSHTIPFCYEHISLMLCIAWFNLLIGWFVCVFLRGKRDSDISFNFPESNENNDHGYQQIKFNFSQCWRRRIFHVSCICVYSGKTQHWHNAKCYGSQTHTFTQQIYNIHTHALSAYQSKYIHTYTERESERTTQEHTSTTAYSAMNDISLARMKEQFFQRIYTLNRLIPIHLQSYCQCIRNTKKNE